ncbi:ATP-binding cassette domain-containing protein [Williamsoniiplasma lucivorax]|uniref:ABC transporter ATP-binding protein n=1 Tax=Williamsoniiplasma lucivorax TaxID=209274 RepID=A0A2S5RDH0_9MOLU|nr:ABC transporter ATP-binding protein [Williamsoniiplasma lucivorax]PPE05252.1 ABC transporter ATP-binding protein [Williamsoniiplasma lucivorax]
MSYFQQTNEPVIEFKEITKLFKEGRGIRDISFDITKENNIVGLIGNNGAGKTTLLKTLFKEYTAQNGEILINGEPLENKHLKKMAFFPDQNNFPKHFNIIEFAKFSAELKGIKPKDYVDKLEKLIRFLKLENFRKSKFTKLSAGQQKRALLLSVLITNPKIIALDEPTANLDVDARIEFQEILKTLANDLKISIIITSHIIDEMENLINKVVLIKDGVIVYDNNYSLVKDGKLEVLYKDYVTYQKQQIKVDKQKAGNKSNVASLVDILRNEDDD